MARNYQVKLNSTVGSYVHSLFPGRLKFNQVSPVYIFSVFVLFLYRDKKSLYLNSEKVF
jgi:hypothetical protein